jgi:hypothetical protein
MSEKVNREFTSPYGPRSTPDAQASIFVLLLPTSPCVILSLNSDFDARDASGERRVHLALASGDPDEDWFPTPTYQSRIILTDASEPLRNDCPGINKTSIVGLLPVGAMFSEKLIGCHACRISRFLGSQYLFLRLSGVASVPLL